MCGGNENAYKSLVAKSEGKRHLQRPRHIWEVNIKVDLQERGCEDVEWIHVAQDEVKGQVLVNMVMNLWVP
jgi:hypothetical protein